MEKKKLGVVRYPQEMKDRAVKMVLELRQADAKGIGVIVRVARQLHPEPKKF